MFNPILADTGVSLSSGYQEVTVSAKCSFVRLYPLTGTMYFYLNSTENIKVLLSEPMTIENVDGRVGKVIFTASAAATANMKQIQNMGGEIVRA